MIADPQTRRDLAARLADVSEVMASGRRVPPEEVVRTIRERCDLSTVLGATSHVVEQSPYPNPTVGSASQIEDALLLTQSGPGSVSWRTGEVNADLASTVCFVFSLAMGNGSGVPQPSVTFALDLEGREVARFCLVKGARQWVAHGAVFGFFPLRTHALPYGSVFEIDDVLRGESTLSDGYGVLFVDRELVAPGRTNELTIRALSEQPSRHWARVGLSSPWFPMFYAESHLDAIRGSVAPREPRRFGNHQLLLGDLHSHSGESKFLDELPEGIGADEPCGIGSRASMFRYARDVADLDFFCLSEHDWQMDERDWADLKGLNESFLSESFVTIHGFEWTSQVYGHRNVYFAEDPGSLYYSQDPRVPYGDFMLGERPSPTDLWAHLRREGLPAITVPHHMSAAQFPLDLRDFNDPDFDRVAEIYSAWGDSLEHGQPVNVGASRLARLEWVRAIREGYRTGFIASSDSHDGHPGNAQGTPSRPHIFHHLGSGRAGVFAEDATRTGIFSALHDRRSFAGTSDGMAVWTSLDGDPMGSETRGRGSAAFEMILESDLPLSTVSIYRNGRISERIDLLGETHVETSWTERRDGDESTASIFVKVVRQDGEMVWSSPHWLV